MWNEFDDIGHGVGEGLYALDCHSLTLALSLLDHLLELFIAEMTHFSWFAGCDCVSGWPHCWSICLSEPPGLSLSPSPLSVSLSLFLLLFLVFLSLLNRSGQMSHNALLWYMSRIVGCGESERSWQVARTALRDGSPWQHGQPPDLDRNKILSAPQSPVSSIQVIDHPINKVD